MVCALACALVYAVRCALRCAVRCGVRCALRCAVCCAFRAEGLTRAPARARASRSRIATFSADEIKFVLSNKRFKMGKPILTDAEYDTLRAKLKAAGSPVIIHDAAKCDVETGVCKADMRVDTGKTRLLYLPGTLGGALLCAELSFWTLHLDPLLSLLLGALPSYFFGVWFTENVFAQKPLVVQTACPNCGAVNTVFFGDLFSVMTDGLAGPPAPPTDVVSLKCASCKKELTADRKEMLVTSPPKA